MFRLEMSSDSEDDRGRKKHGKKHKKRDKEKDKEQERQREKEREKDRKRDREREYDDRKVSPLALLLFVCISCASLHPYPVKAGCGVLFVLLVMRDA